MRVPGLFVVFVLGACGRVGFDDQRVLALGDALTSGDGAGSASADASTMNMVFVAIADTYIVQGSNTPNENATQLTVGTTAASNPAVALVRFDLSALPATLTITSATLRLFQVSSMGTGTIDVAVERVTAAWDPAAVTYATRPTWDVTQWATSSVVLGAQGSQTWSVTPLVQGWSNGTYPNLGIQLSAANAPSSSIVQLGSVETPVSTQPPVLLVVGQ